MYVVVAVNLVLCCFHSEMPYGDQGLFMWRHTFDKVGGYPQFKLMEDYEMVYSNDNWSLHVVCFLKISRIKKVGHVKIVTGAPALTSARRWEKYGYIRVSAASLALESGEHVQ